MNQTALVWFTGKDASEGGNEAAMPVAGQTQDVVAQLNQATKGVVVIEVVLSFNKVPVDDSSTDLKRCGTTPMAKIRAIGLEVDSFPRGESNCLRWSIEKRIKVSPKCIRRDPTALTGNQ